MSLSAHVVVIKDEEILLIQRADFKIWVCPAWGGGAVWQRDVRWPSSRISAREAFAPRSRSVARVI
jgi:hypothetical protein